jgi:hypothetical protein
LEKYRIDYIRGKINENKWKILIDKYKSRQRIYNNLADIFDTIRVVLVEKLIQLYQALKNNPQKEMNKFRKEIEIIREVLQPVHY